MGWTAAQSIVMKNLATLTATVGVALLLTGLLIEPDLGARPAAFAQPAHAGEKVELTKPISEAEVQIASDAAYTELLRQALDKGWRFAPEQIEKGYRRHFEEFKLQFIDQGYTILAGEVGV